jgi:type I restriction enzyme R subunit
MVHELSEEVGKEFDPFDLVCHVAYDMPPLTRKERANNVKKRNYFAQYGEQARGVIDSLLDKYADTGITDIENPKILEIAPINKYGTPSEIVGYFGGIDGYKEALKDLRAQLYTSE